MYASAEAQFDSVVQKLASASLSRAAESTLGRSLMSATSRNARYPSPALSVIAIAERKRRSPKRSAPHAAAAAMAYSDMSAARAVSQAQTRSQRGTGGERGSVM